MDKVKQICRRVVAEQALAAMPAEMHPVLRRVYAARGATAAELNTALAGLIPISRMDGAAEASERLCEARIRQQRVLIVGDFDADGATATALMMTCLRQFGFSGPRYLVPDREKFGYGLSVGIVYKAAELKPDLIVTVDNGISSLAGVDAANDLGIDVIVTDHHLPGDHLPAARVIVNPNAANNRFPSRCLAGVGVAFYVMAALGQRLAAEGLIDAGVARGVCANCLDLVALGTVADLVPLDFNNRILVSQGLARMRQGGARPGITALFAAANRSLTYATAADLGFAIAPRLNAAGRLDDMSVGIECLLAADAERASQYARTLSQLNAERRELQQKMQDDAESRMAELAGYSVAHAENGVCLFDPSWHPGVVGLIATRIKDHVNRPVIAFAAGSLDGDLKGSGRSVAGVHLRDVLAAIDAQHPGMIRRFGGHAMAAGLSLPPELLERFREAFAAEVSQHTEAIDDIARLWSDGELEPRELSLELAEELRRGGPWGQAFPEPAFEGQFEVVAQKIVGEFHLKLELLPAGGARSIDAIAFNHAELLPVGKSRKCFAVYRLDVNEFRQQRTAQLVVEHIECV